MPLQRNKCSEKQISFSNKLVKALFIIAYNTNTIVVNPRIYLEFLIPFLILEGKITWITILAYITSLCIYNIAYMVNDYIDYSSDITLKRRKKSFIHFYEKNFIAPLIPMAIVIFLGILLFGIRLIPIIVITAILAYLHSRYYNLKPVTILFLRFLRISLPPLLLLLVEPHFRNLLLFSLALFPIYNLKSYVEYIKNKKLGHSGFGVILSMITSGIFVYLCRNNIINLSLYIIIFSILFFGVKILVDKIPQIITSPFKRILRNLNYGDIEDKSKELMRFLIYLLLLGVVVWF